MGLPAKMSRASINIGYTLFVILFRGIVDRRAEAHKMEYQILVVNANTTSTVHIIYTHTHTAHTDTLSTHTHLE